MCVQRACVRMCVDFQFICVLLFLLQTIRKNNTEEMLNVKQLKHMPARAHTHIFYIHSEAQPQWYLSFSLPLFLFLFVFYLSFGLLQGTTVASPQVNALLLRNSGNNLLFLWVLHSSGSFRIYIHSKATAYLDFGSSDRLLREGKGGKPIAYYPAVFVQDALSVGAPQLVKKQDPMST